MNAREGFKVHPMRGTMFGWLGNMSQVMASCQNLCTNEFSERLQGSETFTELWRHTRLFQALLLVRGIQIYGSKDFESDLAPVMKPRFSLGSDANFLLRGLPRWGVFLMACRNEQGIEKRHCSRLQMWAFLPVLGHIPKRKGLLSQNRASLEDARRILGIQKQADCAERAALVEGRWGFHGWRKMSAAVWQRVRLVLDRLVQYLGQLAGRCPSTALG